jgi:hypothetical protein
MKWPLLLLASAGCTLLAAAQTQPTDQAPSALASRVAPVISTVTLSPDTVSDLRLKPFYAATIRMPEAVSSVVVGAPTLFLAEHNEREPDLVIVKPITAQPAVSNLLIATKSGQAVSLRLISGGSNAASEPVDFELIYKHRSGFLIGGVDDAPADAKKSQPSPYDLAFQEQAQRSSPEWLPAKDGIRASVGSITADGDDMVVAFSVLNTSPRWIELLPPQVELANSKGKKVQADKAEKSDKKVLADQVAIHEFRFSERKLAPGARADGVVRFARPDFKQYQENLQLALATADAVNRPLLIPLPFTAPSTTKLQGQR